MIIRKIRPEDTWPIRHQVMWPDKPLAFVQVEEDALGTHYGLYQDDRLASVISCFEAGGEMQFRKFATLNEKQGQGLGTYLLQFILKEAQKKGISRIWCNARLDKKGFYEKFGFRETGERFCKAGVAFTIMERKVGQPDGPAPAQN